MIKNILLPEKIGTYYLFPKRILGIELGKTFIHASLVYFNGTSVVIEKFFTIILEKNTNNYNERASKGLEELIAQVGHFDAIHSTLPSSFVTFKELKLPFLDREKISMVLEYEIEPLLPFSLDDVVIDFIITKAIPEEKSSEILVAVIQKRSIEEHLNIFQSIAINPDIITIDLIALFGTYQRLPSYTETIGSVAFVAVDSHTTRISYHYRGQLRFIRTLPTGLVDVAKNMGATLNTQTSQIMEDLVRFGIEETTSSFQEALKNELAELWKRIQFTLDSFIGDQEKNENGKTTIILFGQGSTIAGMERFVSSTTGLPCFNLKLHDLLENRSLNIKINNGLPQTAAVSFSAAFLNSSVEHFNLRKKEFSNIADEKKATKQIIMALVLTMVLISTLLLHSFLQTRKLKRSITQSKSEITTALTREFKKLPLEEDIEEIVNAAQRDLQKEKKLWSSLANPYRFSPLHYLLELTNKIDKERLDFEINKLSIVDNIMTLSARVKDHKALAVLEKELRSSKLFLTIEGDLDEPVFTMKIKLVQNL